MKKNWLIMITIGLFIVTGVVYMLFFSEKAKKKRLISKVLKLHPSDFNRSVDSVLNEYASSSYESLLALFKSKYPNDQL